MLKRFECERCGECCKGQSRLDKEDIKKILKLGYKLDFFVEKTNTGNYMKTKDEQCIFLSQIENGKYFCKIYPMRPYICKAYPGSLMENCQPKRWFENVEMQ